MLYCLFIPYIIVKYQYKQNFYSYIIYEIFKLILTYFKFNIICKILCSSVTKMQIVTRMLHRTNHQTYKVWVKLNLL